MKLNPRSTTAVFGLSIIFTLGIFPALAQTKPTATPAAPMPTRTPTLEPTLTPTPRPKGTELVLQIASAADDVNESSGNLIAGDTNLWIGNLGTNSDQYLGLRFTDVTIPSGSTIHSARLEVYTTADQWIYLAYDIAAEAADDSAPFAITSLPSSRPLTEAVVNHESDVPWVANTLYPLDDITEVVQEVISRPGWQSGNSLSIIVEGNELGGDFSRKLFAAYESDPRAAVRLVIDFSAGTTAAQDAACAEIALPARLSVGQEGQIDANAALTSLDLRETASAAADVVGTLDAEVSFTVVDGPVCAEGSRWFQVSIGDDLEGWLAEAQPNPYFLAPSP